MSKYIFYWVKKKLVWVFLEQEEIRDKDNATGLIEGKKEHKDSNYSAFHNTTIARSPFTFLYILLTHGQYSLPNARRASLGRRNKQVPGLFNKSKIDERIEQM